MFGEHGRKHARDNVAKLSTALTCNPFIPARQRCFPSTAQRVGLLDQLRYCRHRGYRLYLLRPCSWLCARLAWHSGPGILGASDDFLNNRSTDARFGEIWNGVVMADGYSLATVRDIVQNFQPSRMVRPTGTI